MYFVINKTKKHITFQDISITLGPRQCIDLQRVMKKEKYINSRHLRIAQGNGDIDIRISTKESKKQQKNIIKKDDSAVDMEKIKNDIIKEMKKEFKNIGQKEDSLSKKDLVEIMTEVIKKLQKEKIKKNREE